jgi:hypothetical protein
MADDFNKALPLTTTRAELAQKILFIKREKG